MKTGSKILFDTLFMLALVLLAAQGALICFLPERWKAVRARFPRGYNPDSPGGRMMERYRTRKATFADRFGGFALLIMALAALVWFAHRF
ncbi:exported hypothetical protein [Candidatus Sulfotelmatobacter kueseliae]|uniref:Uncharacterized protein n=1 Tax=Candidatus Sulfotelmatobacter kueseliae TaxID=2042962 RepID=A0A2U3L0D6_9BACT|nr:exported hypothetical protein [Candidatus Sulfotelmatobacter kueseliae]